MQHEHHVTDYLDEMVRMTSEMVKIPSVKGDPLPGMPFGKPAADCLAYALETAKRLGFRTVNMENYCGYAEVGEGEEMIGILIHLDVVPVGENWTIPPFDGFIKDGRIWGRGAADNKYAGAMILYAIRTLMDNGIQWKKRVRVIFGCDEECTWKDMEYYRAHAEWPTFGFVPDGRFPLTNAEKGILHFEFIVPPEEDDFRIQELAGGERPNVVLARSVAKVEGTVSGAPVPEDISMETKDRVTTLVSTGKSAHGSTPEWGRNAGYQMMHFLRDCGWKGNLIDFVNDAIGNDLRGAGFGLDHADEASGALSLNMGVLEKTADGNFRIVMDMRYPVTDEYDWILEKLRNGASAYDAHVQVIERKKPLYLAADNPLITALMEVYRNCTGRDDPLIQTGGGTFARAMPNLVAFGPGLPDGFLDHGCHNADEFISIDEIRRASVIFEKSIEALQDVSIG